MSLGVRTWISCAVAIAAWAYAPQAIPSRPDPLVTLAKRIESLSAEDSSAVLVAGNDALLQALKASLPHSIPVISFSHPESPRGSDTSGMGQLFRVASAATVDYTDLWVVSIGSSGQSAKRGAYAFAEITALTGRHRVLRDTLRVPQGTVIFSRWVDSPGGVLQRRDSRRAFAYADSVKEGGGPRLIPINHPFTRSELAVDADTVTYYVAHLADTSFYSIGGCSDVAIVYWHAPEKLGQMGPGVVPILVKRIADPNPFVRERVQEALLLATQDERILARTGGEYLKFYDQPTRSAQDLVQAWWSKFAHYWVPADSTR